LVVHDEMEFLAGLDCFAEHLILMLCLQQ
jgi:hypothetical protein